MKLSPFATTARQEFTQVGGAVWMKSTKGIHPNERTEEVQKLEAEIAAIERDRISLLWSVLQISEREAKKRGITPDEARAQIFGGKTLRAAEGDAEIVQESPMSLVQNESELRALLGDGAKDEAGDRLKLELKRLVATNMLRSRLAWTVEVERSKAGSVQLSASRPVLFDLEAGQKLRFGETVVEVSGEVTEWEDVIPVNKLKSAVEGVGYLLNDSGRECVGSPDWTHQMTCELLIDPQIDAIYEFFLEQDAGGAQAVAEAAETAEVESPEEQMGNSLTPSTEEVPPPSLNGAKSSSDSKPLVAKIGA